MRKLTAGNKSRFTMFTIVIVVIIVLLVIFLNKMINSEKEYYEITKEMFIYDKNYEHIELTGDAIIEKKWTGNYYLKDSQTGLSYDLGKSAIAYDSIKNLIELYGNFYEVSLDGEVTKTSLNTKVTNMLEPKLYKIDDRKYLIVSRDIITENSSITEENYLIVILDKSGNTLLLNNNIDVKTINAIILDTGTFKFDVANEKLIYDKSEVDLKKIIGSTNQYIEKKEEESNNNQNGSQTVNVGGSTANSNYNPSVSIGGTTIINNSGNSNNNSNNNNNNNNNNSTNIDKNQTKVVKSASLRSVTPGSTYLDVNYMITDPENKYQVVYLMIDGGENVDKVSLDKSNTAYRITGLKPNTEYSITLGYKEIKSDNTVEEVTEDVLNVRTLKLGGNLSISKVTPERIYFNIQLDQNSNYDNATIKVYVNGVEQNNEIAINAQQAITAGGWTSSIERTDEMLGRVTLKLDNVKDVELSTSIQIY